MLGLGGTQPEVNVNEISETFVGFRSICRCKKYPVPYIALAVVGLKAWY